MDADKLIATIGGQPSASAAALCVASSDPDHLALTETFRLCRGYATDAASDKAFAYLETVLHAPTMPFRAYLLEDVSILGSGHALVCEDRVITESRDPLGQSVSDCLKKSLRAEVRTLEAATTWIVCANVLDDGNHWHWMAQHLPAILQSLTFADALGSKKIGLVTPSLSKVQKRSLELLGFGALPRVEISEDQTVLARNAIFSDVQSNVGWMRPSALRTLIGDGLRSAANQPGVQGVPLIYASRSDTKRRPMLNEPELERRLSELGFRVVRFGDHSLDEQIALFKCRDGGRAARRCADKRTVRPALSDDLRTAAGKLPERYRGIDEPYLWMFALGRPLPRRWAGRTHRRLAVRH